MHRFLREIEADSSLYRVCTDFCGKSYEGSENHCILTVCTDFCGNYYEGSKNHCKFTICTDFCGNLMQILYDIFFARIFAEIWCRFSMVHFCTNFCGNCLEVPKMMQKSPKMTKIRGGSHIYNYKNLQKMRWKSPKYSPNFEFNKHCAKTPPSS